MLQIDCIKKQYHTGTLVQKALDGVSLCFRDNEFVAILGPSGSGKTTLLNIIGGLDRYDSGDLIIDGVSTKQYSERDWDAYRNHSIGFVFQSYNLIPHQNILSNVELALTISGVPKAERRRRAEEALAKVGLGAHIHKLPSQLSGGQMQRVAIARALVNDPAILLADEPTGALDTETSLQVMALLKEVAEQRLVIMVTHNTDLAETFATRVVTLLDGRIMSDSDAPETAEGLEQSGDPGRLEQSSSPACPGLSSDPNYSEQSDSPARPERSGMSFRTALQLSFHNLLTKKARTILVALAGSIGIIGIALILAASNGINGYISNIEEDTLSEYPIEVTSNSFSVVSMLENFGTLTGKSETVNTGSAAILKTVSSLLSKMSSNDLSSLKIFLESDYSGIDPYTRYIRYIYDIKPLIYRMNHGHAEQVNPYSALAAFETDMSFLGSSVSSYRATLTEFFHEMPEDEDLYKNQYALQAGRWPRKYNECVVVLNASNSVSDLSLFVMGLADDDTLKTALNQYFTSGGIDPDVDLAIPDTVKYEDFMGIRFSVVNACDCYEHDSRYDVWTDKKENQQFMDELAASSENLTIVGVVKATDDTPGSMLHAGINYPSSLTDHLIEYAAESEIVQAQLADPTVDVTTGKYFDDTSKEAPDLTSSFSIDRDKLRDSISLNTDHLSNTMIRALSDAILKKVSFKDIDLKKALPSDKVLREMLQEALDSEGSSVVPALTRDELVEILKTVSPEIDEEVLIDAMEQLLVAFLETADPSVLFDPSAFSTAFIEFLSTEEAGQILDETIFENVEVVELETEIAQKITEYMVSRVSLDSLEPSLHSALESYARAVSKVISAKIKEELRKTIVSTGLDLTSYFSSKMSPENIFNFNEDAAKDAVKLDMDTEDLNALLSSYLSDEDSSLEKNLKEFGYADSENPNEILIYPKDFDSKGKLAEILDAYNQRMLKSGQDEKVISFTDMMGTMMSSISRIVDAVSLVLIAFISISLIVSSIMIGVITYISVLERRKEIGILRSLGASRRNVANVFNAETAITGLFAGLLGIGLTLLLLIPANVILRTLTGQDVLVYLPATTAVLLVLLSVVLTLIGGLIPSRKAATSDPVAALRDE